MTNAIAALISSGYAQDVATAAKGGESYQFTEGGVKGSAPATQGLEDAARRLREAASAYGGVATLWCAVSTDRQRVQGEVLLRLKPRAPSIIWDLQTGEAILKLAQTRSVTFPSIVDVSQAVIEPALLLDACGEDGGSLVAAASTLGYRIDWRPGDKLSHSVDCLPLVEA